MASISSHPPIFLTVSLLTVGKSQVYQDRGVSCHAVDKVKIHLCFFKKSFVLFCFVLFFTVMCILWDLSSLTRDWTPGPQHWKCKVLTTGQPGSSKNPCLNQDFQSIFSLAHSVQKRNQMDDIMGWILSKIREVLIPQNLQMRPYLNIGSLQKKSS